MTIQKSLFSNGNKSTHLIESVPLSDVELSEHNPRRTWDDAHITRLAELIDRNGYDGTDAIKCYKEGDRYKCFAGSNRLKACQKVGLESIPVYLYEGYTPEEIWKMAYDDNDQAGTQQRLCVVDVWEDYAAKEAQGWTQERIEKILNVSRTVVSHRLSFSSFPDEVKLIFKSKGLRESHARELHKILQCKNTVFCNGKSAYAEVLQNVLSVHSNPQAKHFAAEVTKYNRLIDTINEWSEKLTGEYLDRFLEKIKDERSVAVIANEGKLLKDEQDEAEAAVQQWVIHGDSAQEIDSLPEGTKLVITDPPYGMGYQSNRPTATAKKSLIDNDADLDSAIQLIERVMEKAYPKMAQDSAVLMWCDWRSEPEFRAMLGRVGFQVKNSIIWVKNNHGTGDLYGSFAPKHERLLFAVKGRPQFYGTRLPDVLRGNEFLDTRHPTPKPIDLIGAIIENLTLKQEIIADPFMGTAPTGVAALRCGRRFWGCELKKEWWDEASRFIESTIKDDKERADRKRA